MNLLSAVLWPIYRLYDFFDELVSFVFGAHDPIDLGLFLKDLLFFAIGFWCSSQIGDIRFAIQFSVLAYFIGGMLGLPNRDSNITLLTSIPQSFLFGFVVSSLVISR